MIENRQLRHCRTLAEYGHFGRAAEILGISQPALTRSIQNLESTMGVALFNREARRVSPTVFGELLLTHGEKILSEGEELIRNLQLMQGLELGELSVSAGLYPSEISVHGAVGRMMRAHPNIRCRVQLRDWRAATADVLERRADIAVAETSEAESDRLLVTKTVGQHDLAFFCRPGHPLATEKNLSTNRIFAYPWASTRAPARITDYFPKNLRAAGWIDKTNGDFVSAIQVDTTTTAMQVVLESDTLSPSPPILFDREVKSGLLVQLDFQRPWLRLNYGFIYLRERILSPAAKAFITEVEILETSQPATDA
jgi:DNA-binding transcriptional LysR family regulator